MTELFSFCCCCCCWWWFHLKRSDFREAKAKFLACHTKSTWLLFLFAYASPPFCPSLISRTVSVDVKNHVYLLTCPTGSRTLRSSSDTRMLEIQQYKRKTHGFRTSCFGPHIRNSLPQDLRLCSTLSSFKLKTFLFSQYFHHN